MKAACPNGCKNPTFVTTMHVVQTVIVDENGMFLEEVQTDEVTHDVDPDNEWGCAECGADATVER